MLGPERETSTILAGPVMMLSSQHLLNRLRFKQLALLVALDDHRNLHRAADAVHLAQPSATKLIHDLELLFGVKLFERLPRGMQATEIGGEIVTFARRMLIDLDRFTQDLDSKRQGGFGQLMVGAIMGAAPDVVAHAVTEMKRLRPLLVVKLLGETSDEILNLLAQRRIDLDASARSCNTTTSTTRCWVTSCCAWSRAEITR